MMKQLGATLAFWVGISLLGLAQDVPIAGGRLWEVAALQAAPLQLE